MSKPPIHAADQNEREEAAKIEELKRLFGCASHRNSIATYATYPNDHF